MLSAFLPGDAGAGLLSDVQVSREEPAGDLADSSSGFRERQGCPHAGPAGLAEPRPELRGSWRCSPFSQRVPSFQLLAAGTPALACGSDRVPCPSLQQSPSCPLPGWMLLQLARRGRGEVWTQGDRVKEHKVRQMAVTPDPKWEAQRPTEPAVAKSPSDCFQKELLILRESWSKAA